MAPHAGEMVVGRSVRIEARAGSVDGLAKQARLDKQSQISIHRAEADMGEPAAHTSVDAIRRGVQRAGPDDLKNKPSGPRQPEATSTQSLDSLIGRPSQRHCRQSSAFPLSGFANGSPTDEQPKARNAAGARRDGTRKNGRIVRVSCLPPPVHDEEGDSKARETLMTAP